MKQLILMQILLMAINLNLFKYKAFFETQLLRLIIWIDNLVDNLDPIWIAPTHK